MDTPRARENEPLSVDAVARAARAPFAEARGRGRCAENGGDDAAGFDEAGRQAGIVDAGDMGDDPGCQGWQKGHQRVALSGHHEAARCGIS